MSAKEFTSKLPRVSRNCEFIHKRHRSQRNALASNRHATALDDGRGGEGTSRVFFGPQ
jgi:hypothetical protein